MKTFTTYAEKKAKQFLNLLQGYTKGIRLTAILILLLMGVSNAWGADWHLQNNPSHIYFCDATTKWAPNSSDHIIFLMGRDDNYGNEGVGSQAYDMKHLSNTKLWYYNVPEWGDGDNGRYQYIAFRHATSAWTNWENNTVTNRAKWNNSKYSMTRNDNISGKTLYYEPQSSTTNTNTNVTGYLPKYTATVDFKVSRDGGSSYNVTNKKFGTITLKGTYMNGDAATGQSSETIIGEAEYNYDNIPVTGEFTLTNTALTNEAYEFVGFGTGNTPTDKVNTKTWNITENTTYYVFYKHKLYTVTYSKGTYGSGSNQTANKLHGETLALADKAFTRTGYTQTGWSTSDGGAKVYDLGGNYTANTNVTLYPFWTPNQYTITYKHQGGSNFSDTDADGLPTTHTYGTETILKDPTRLGFIFGGWFTSPDCTGTAVTSLGATAYTADITLYAKWTPVPTLEISTNQQYLRVGKDKLQLSITYANIPAGHYYRVKVGTGYWNGNAEGADEYRVAISGDGSVTFKSNQPLGLGEQTIIVELWKDGPTGTSSTPVTVTVEQDHQVAVYAYLDGVRSEAGGRITSTTPIFPTANIKETITASQPNPGYSFVNWTASNGNFTFIDPNSLSTTVTATGGGDIYANYTETKHNVTIKANNNTYGTVSSESISVGQHTASSPITATQNAGCRFVSWTATPGITIANATSPSTTITATQGGTLTANFEEIKHNITVVSSNNAHGTVDKSSVNVGQYNVSEQIKATAKNGYKFVNWTATDGINITNSANATTTIKATKAGTLTANFEEDLSTNWYLAHSIDGFNTSSHPFVKKSGESTGKVAYVSLDLEANTAYTFKVKNGSIWYGNNNSGAQYWIKATVENWTFYDDAGDCHMQSSVAGTYTFKIDFSGTDPKVSVYFPTAYTLTYGSGAGGSGTVAIVPDIASGTLVAAGTDLELSATPNLGYKFVGWYSEAACTNQVSTANPYNFPINSNTTLYAKFEQRNLYIHTDIIWEWGTALMTQDKNNKAVYTYTNTLGKLLSGKVGDAWDVGYHFHFVNTPTNPNDNIAYNWYGVQNPTSEGASIDGVRLTFPANPTIQFGLTRKSDVTITLTLQSANDDPKPTVHISAIPYYNITLDQTGCAQPGTDTVEVKSGNAMPEIVLPEAPTGYIFGGYYDQEDGAGKKYYEADGTSANTWDKNDDRTLYAQWTPKEYAITYRDQGDKAFSGTHANGYPTTHTYNTTTTLLGATKSGYTFAGWYSDSECAGARVETLGVGVTEAITLYAKWDVASYTINFELEGGTGETTELTVPFGTQLPNITIPTKAGYLFLGYYNGNNGTGTQYYDASGKGLKTMPANDLTLYANWLDGRDCIFFYNNLGWQNVYVYFYNGDYWDASKGSGAKIGGTYQGYAKMTQIAETNIWYVNASGKSTNYLVFGKENQDGHENFDNTEVVRRGDYNKAVPMYVPIKAAAEKLNQHDGKEALYYNKGYWMNYPTNTGYKLHIFDENGNTINAQLVDIPFEYGDNMIMPWSVNVSLEGPKTYAFKIQRADDEWFGNDGKMTSENSGDEELGKTAWAFTPSGNNCKLTTTAPGTYVFTLKYDKNKEGEYDYRVSVKYPASVGDYRLAYKDNAHPFHPGHLLKKRDGKDTISFFVHHNLSPVIMLQQVTDINANTGAITWETLKTYALTANQAGSENPGQAMMPGRRMANEVILHIGNEHMDGVDTTGIYNFVLEQTDSIATLQNTATKYTGNFYIRTNAAAGGWGEFREAGNKMTYSSYAESNSDFNHYFVEWINAGTNVKFTIANDYSYCISDTLDGDAIVDNGWLPANANVRFGWDSRNNKLTRAYIAGSGFVGDRFLVVTGNNLLKNADNEILAAGPQGNTDQDKAHPRYRLNDNEDIFKDLGNWVYQVDVTAQHGTMINLTALYNGTIQYFKGAEGEPSYPLLASTNVGKEYKIRMIYNFKTNNLVVAWMPESPYNVRDTTEHLGTDMLLIRRNQEQATQLQLNSVAEKDTISGVKTAYAVMTFTKTFVEDDKKPIHERKHYWVSFPFDVKISDVFGFSEYKDHWIMQAYDGAGRAANGLWADTDTYWKYITNANYVMRKGQGYVLTLDVKKMLELDPVFENTEEVSLYFPSRGELDTITSYLPTAATVPAHTCTIERENRKIYDSHWNMIGVPGFADIANFETTAPDTYLEELGYQSDSLSFYYAYIPAENSYKVRTTDTTFQSMYSYMVQFAGTINWSSKEVTYNGQQQLAARRNSEGEYPEKVSFRLELAQGDKMADQTFVQLQEEGATPEFDMNLDLTKIINSGANIYTLAGESRIQSAGNALPMGEAVVVPVGVKVDAEGEYTFRMPDGTEGMVVELVDYETYNRTNLLLTDYTVTLPKGTNEYRFALHIQPQKDVVTSLENIGEGVNNGEAVNKYLIDGKLIIRTAEGIFDAQGKRL